MLPDNLEVVFWHAVTPITVAKQAEALPLFRRVFARERRWADLVPRLQAAVA